MARKKRTKPEPPHAFLVVWSDSANGVHVNRVNLNIMQPDHEAEWAAVRERIAYLNNEPGDPTIIAMITAPEHPVEVVTSSAGGSGCDHGGRV